jgi:hypothetical protein
MWGLENTFGSRLIAVAWPRSGWGSRYHAERGNEGELTRMAPGVRTKPRVFGRWTARITRG